MECNTSTLSGLPLSSRDSSSLQLFTLPQWHVFMCRARWMVTPHASDEGAAPPQEACDRWQGATKAFFWLAVSIVLGMLIAGLSG